MVRVLGLRMCGHCAQEDVFPEEVTCRFCGNWLERENREDVEKYDYLGSLRSLHAALAGLQNVDPGERMTKDELLARGRLEANHKLSAVTGEMVTGMAKDLEYVVRRLLSQRHSSKEIADVLSICKNIGNIAEKTTEYLNATRRWNGGET